MTLPEPDTDLAVAFLTGLDRDGRHDLVAIDPYVKVGNIECATFLPIQRAEMREWIAARQGKRNIYTSVNQARDDAPKNKRLCGYDKKKNQLSTIGSLRAIVVDIDPAKGGDSSGDKFRAERARLQHVAQQIADDPVCPPMMLVDSGGGLQVWWQLEKQRTATPENVDLYKGIGRALAKKYGGDSVFSEAQIMRLPGTINILSPDKKKQGRTPALATVLIEQSPGEMSTLERLVKWTPPTPEHAKLEGRLKSAITPGVVETSDYAELPAELREKFEEYRAEYPEVDDLWNGKPARRQRGESPSEYVYALAGLLRGHDAFTIDEFAQLVAVWEHRSENHAHEFERYVANAWNRNPTPLATESFEAHEVRERGARTDTQALKIEWGKPADLWSTRSEPPDLAVGVVPQAIECLARDQAKRLGVEAGACAAALVTAIGALVPAGTQMQPRQHDTGWTVKPILWTALIGDPGTNKTAIVDYATEAARTVESRWMKKYTVERSAYDRALASKRKSNAKDAKATAAKETAAFVTPPSDLLEDWPDELSEPVQRRKVVRDSTTEKLCAILSNNPDGLLFIADELAGLFGGMDTYHAKAGKDQPIWLQAKQGGHYSVDRKGHETINVENLAISVLGGIQPSKIKSMGTKLTEDGMLQRFLPVIVKQHGVGEDVAPNREYAETVKRIAASLVEFKPSDVFKLTIEGDVEWRTLQAFQQTEIKRAATSPVLRQWLDKMPGEFGRLALVFHLIEWFAVPGRPGESIPLIVSGDTARRVRRLLVEFAYPHARTFYESVMGHSPHEDHVTWVAAHILAHGLSVVSERDIYRAYTRLKTAEWRRILPGVMQALEMEDWLSPNPGWLRDGRPTRWLVNPAVHEAFAAKAAEERQARLLAQKSIREEGARRQAERVANSAAQNVLA